MARALRWCVFSAAISAASASSASPSARLTYVRGEGSESCPDEAALRRAVAQRLGYDPFFPSASKSVVAEIQKTPRGYASRILIVADDGRPLGERKIPPSGNDCSETVRATALAISIALDDLDTSAPSPKPEPEVEPEPPRDTMPAAEPPAAEQAATKVPEPAAPASPPASPTPPRSIVTWRAHAGGHLAFGSAPSIAPGVRLGGALAIPSAWVSLEARLDTSASTSLAEGGRIAASTTGGSLLVCWQPGVPSFCGTFGAFVFHARGEALDVSRSDDALLLTTGARVAIDVTLSRALSLRPTAEIDLALQRHRIDVTNVRRFELPALVGFAGVDFVLHDGSDR